MRVNLRVSLTYAPMVVVLVVVVVGPPARSTPRKKIMEIRKHGRSCNSNSYFLYLRIVNNKIIMNLLSSLLIISAATAASAFQVAPAARVVTQLHGTGEGGQGREDALMYFAPKKVPKQAAAKKEVAPKKKKVAPAWQLDLFKTKVAPKKVVEKKVAPKKVVAEKKAAPKKVAPKKKVVAAKAPAPEKKKAGGFSFGKKAEKAPVAAKEEAPKKKAGFSFGAKKATKAAPVEEKEAPKKSKLPAFFGKL